MSGASRRSDSGDRSARLRRSFVAGTSWPIDKASLSALNDLGLSNTQIAEYFDIAPAEVDRRCVEFGLVPTT